MADIRVSDIDVIHRTLAHGVIVDVEFATMTAASQALKLAYRVDVDKMLPDQ